MTTRKRCSSEITGRFRKWSFGRDDRRTYRGIGSDRHWNYPFHGSWPYRSSSGACQARRRVLGSSRHRHRRAHPSAGCRTIRPPKEVGLSSGPVGLPIGVAIERSTGNRSRSARFATLNEHRHDQKYRLYIYFGLFEHGRAGQRSDRLLLRPDHERRIWKVKGHAPSRAHASPGGESGSSLARRTIPGGNSCVAVPARRGCAGRSAFRSVMTDSGPRHQAGADPLMRLGATGCTRRGSHLGAAPTNAAAPITPPPLRRDVDATVCITEGRGASLKTITHHWRNDCHETH
jgi:hypothetical protein